MALIVSAVRSVANGGKSVKAKCETLVFEKEELGRQFVEENKGFVVHVQKARIVHEQHHD